MRRALLVLLFPLAACDQPAAVPTTVQWMEWPAHVAADASFKVRMVVSWPCAAEGFQSRSTVDASALTLAPFFERQEPGIYCVADRLVSSSLVIGSMDTAAFAPGLPAEYSRPYEVRAATDVVEPAPPPDATGQRVRTFGEVIVSRGGPPPSTVRNAGGEIFSVYVDGAGCVRMQVWGLYRPTGGYVLENTADTAGLSYGFVRGFIYTPETPVCGETEVFRLTGRN